MSSYNANAIAQDDSASIVADEIKVIGYGTMKKSDSWDDVKIIGAGTIIKSDLPVDNIAGTPSHDYRTYAEDLNLKYIVDGKEMTAQEISYIDPNTIKDISVFKGKDSTENSAIVIELIKPEDAQASQLQVIVDGNKMTYEEFTSKYSPNDIKSMTVLKNENKIIITLKKIIESQ